MFENVHSTPRFFDSNFSEHVQELPKANETEENKRKRREHRVKDWWYQEKVRQGPNRQEMAIDEDFYDNLQWEAEDKQALNELGQAALTFNEIHPAIEWIVGTEKRTRVDWTVLPRKKDHEKEAVVKTGVLKYINDVNKLAFHRSRAFKQSVISGLSWMEYGHDEDPGDFSIFGSWESWRNIWPDSLGTDWITMKDWRYIHRSRVMDMDVAQAMFPKQHDALKRAADSVNRHVHWNDDYTETQLFYTGNNAKYSAPTAGGTTLADSHGRRSRVRLIETWYREPVAVKRMANDPEYRGVIYDPKDKNHQALVKTGVVSLYDDVYMQMRVMIHIDDGDVLQDEASPYEHNRFPFVPVYAYIRSRDNLPYGVVRLQRDPQEDLNKRRSKMLYLLSVKRTIMDRGAVDDMDEYAEEVARPDSIIEKRKGYDLVIEENNEVAQQHLNLAAQDSVSIRELGGVTGENLGMETNATSGKAIRARQDQGSVVTQSLFDNWRLHHQMAGEILLSLSEQYLTDEDEFRITGNRNTHEFIHINQPDEEGALLNDISANAADFIVDEQDFRASQREAMFVTMAEMLSQMDSGIAVQMLDLLIDLTDLPQKAEMVSRIRKINGHVDPESETEEDRLAREEQENAAEQQQHAIQMEDIMLDFKKRYAEIAKMDTDNSSARIDAIVKAMEGAGLTLQAPIIGEIAELMFQEGLPPEEPAQMQQQQIEPELQTA